MNDMDRTRETWITAQGKVIAHPRVLRVTRPTQYAALAATLEA